MKSTFSENIKALRKQRGLTQEQLSEAMGITASAVYKWEQKLSVPDIEVIMELASFFGVSVDALIGYKMCTSDKERILQELKRIKLQKDYQTCWEDVEGWLRRYPNDFDIVYHSGVLYNLVGIETRSASYLSRSVTLLNHACSLLGQNKDPKISETAIYKDIAMAYLDMDQGSKGVQLLMEHNPCGVHNDIIGQELATDRERREEALPYLSSALLHSTTSLYRIVIGFMNIFFARKDYPTAVRMLRWSVTYLQGLGTETGPSYLDKDNAALLALLGMLYEKIGDIDQAKDSLRKARRTALRFDAAPDYTSRNIRYCEHLEPQVAYDNIGSTAMDSVLKLLKEGIELPEASTMELWEEVCHEE